MDYYAHPTAIIDQPAQIGAGTKIWHFSHVMSGTVIGEACNLGQNVFVASGVRIGRNCKIQNNVSIYEGVELADDVFCGPSMVFTNIGTPRCEVNRRAQYELTIVEQGATFGANCTIVCGVRIGRYAFIGAGAVVTRDVPAYALMAGVPARRIGWAGQNGERLQPSSEDPRVFVCPATGKKYLQRNENELRAMDEMDEMDTPVPLLDLKAQHARIAKETEATILRVIRDQRFILGPEVEAFEREAAEYLGGPHAIGCASGSDALLLALMALDLKPGDGVLTTPYSFFATVGSIVRLGLMPIFRDIDPVTFNIDFQSMESGTGSAGARTSKKPKSVPPAVPVPDSAPIKAIMPVHLFGQCADMDAAMQEAANLGGAAIIEDAAQAIGARDIAGRRAGSIGAFGCFSFFPSKNLGGYGDGGLITTGDDDLAAKIRLLRTHGAGSKAYEHVIVGINSRLDALQAAVLRVKLKHLDKWSDLRAQHAARYGELFRAAGLIDENVGPAPSPVISRGNGEGRVITPKVVAERHVFNQYVIRVPADDREPLRAHLASRKIGSAVYYPRALHLQPCLAGLGYKEGDFPQAELASRESLALPVYPELTDAQQERVVGAIAEYFKSRSGL